MFNRMDKTTARTKEVQLSSKYQYVNSITSFQHLGSLSVNSSPGAQLSDCFSSHNLTVLTMSPHIYIYRPAHSRGRGRSTMHLVAALSVGFVDG